MNYFNFFGWNIDPVMSYVCLPPSLNSIQTHGSTKLLQIEETAQIEKEKIIYSLLKENQQLKRKCLSLQAAQKTEISVGAHPKNGKKKLIRRKQDELNKKYSCIYGTCKKSYASKLALNLHVKLKHNGRSKRKMDQQAKKIILAEIRGDRPVQPQITFPEGYVENYRLLNMDKLRRIISSQDMNYESDES